ncbi:MAG: SGNH/GDSL hydrolase family protein [Acidimicrobiia bacterium]|nr:SGNH/GDSL hydrolase family protein [Acidimicrobiia bacterium]
MSHSRGTVSLVSNDRSNACPSQRDSLAEGGLAVKSLVVLGDSVGFGVGDEDNAHPNKGVGAFLNKALMNFSSYANYSRPGARMREVFEVQLPKALEHEPDVVVLIAGGNDVLRQNFNPDDIYWSMYGTVTTLRKRGADVLTMKLHDPNRKIRLPKRLARLLHQRVEILNRIIDDVSGATGAQCLDVRRIDTVYDQSVWHIEDTTYGTSPHRFFVLARAKRM